MNRTEAEASLGTTVSAETALRGIYAGTLMEVLVHRPWRGIVRVEFVLDLPTGPFSRIVREGSLLEVGGVNVTPYTGAIATWSGSIESILGREERFLADWQGKLDSGMRFVPGERTALER